MAKKKMYIYLVFIVIIATYCLYDFIRVNMNYTSKDEFDFELPTIPILRQTNLKKDFSIYSVVWIKENREIKSGDNNGKKQLKGNSITRKQIYIYKKVKGIPSLVKKNNSSYRWEFFGIYASDNDTSAIFYNPAIKLVKTLKKGNELDDGLIVKEIKHNSVIVQSGETLFNLQIFKVNTEGK